MFELNPILTRVGAHSEHPGLQLNKRQINKINHIKNGNIGQIKEKDIKKLKILHLNKGSNF